MTDSKAQKRAKRKLLGRKRGQSMLEYLMVMVMSMGIIVMLGLFYVTYKEYGGRMMELVSSEYP